MLNINKKGSVLLQGWIVFLLFVFMVHQFQLNRYYFDQARQSLDKASNVMKQHNIVIEKLRLHTQSCKNDDLECFTQEILMDRFHYLIKFDNETRHVIEIKITNR
jgi:hypothetical protein